MNKKTIIFYIGITIFLILFSGLSFVIGFTKGFIYNPNIPYLKSSYICYKYNHSVLITLSSYNETSQIYNIECLNRVNNTIEYIFINNTWINV